MRALTIITAILFTSINCLGIEGGSLQFITNKGQITDQYRKARTDIDAKIEANGVTLFIGDGRLHYQWTKNTSPNPSQGGESNPNINEAEYTLSPWGRAGEGSESIIYRMDVELVGADKKAKAIFEQPTGYTEHYYTARSGKGGIHAQGYNRITYKNIYPNIDWTIYTQEGQVKYDFIVRPGGNVSDIRFRYEGATNLVLTDGALTATTPSGIITEHAPYNYVAETGVPIAGKYSLKGNTLGFETAAYDGTLIIDPALKWATYYGGGQSDTGYAVATNRFGEVYICGGTNSSTNIATTGAYQTTVGNSHSGYVAKFNLLGQRQWGSYYGDSTVLEGIACDSKGNIYTSGTTSGSGLASSGAFKTTKSPTNAPDALLVKLNGNGQRQWATYYGDSAQEQGIVVACDADDNAILAGSTRSSSGIATSGAHDTFNDGSKDVFIAKFNSSGTRLWGTYYGEDLNGANNTAHSEYPCAVSCDAQNNIYIGGLISSFKLYSNGPHCMLTSGTHQSYTSGAYASYSAFLSKFSGSGSRQWGTLLGVGESAITDIVVDKDSNIYVSGTYRDNNNSKFDSLIASPGTHKTVVGQSNTDAYVVKFRKNGTRIWGTFYGGADYDQGTNLAISSDETKVYLLGTALSDTGIATTNGYQTSRAGASDMFIAEFDSSGQRLWGSYYGGTAKEDHSVNIASNSNRDINSNICTDCTGKLYITGTTGSSTGISTGGTHQSSYGGNTDAMLIAFDIDTSVYIIEPFADTIHCPGDTMLLPYGANLPFYSGNTFKVELSDTNGDFSSPTVIGTINATYVDTIVCVIPMSMQAGSGYSMRIVGSNPERVSCVFRSIRIKPIPRGFGNGNNGPLCSGDSLQLTGSSSSTGVDWTWTGPNGFGSSAKDTFIANTTLADTGDYILTAEIDGCSLSDTTNVVIYQTPQNVTASSNSPVCETKGIQLTGNSTSSGVSYSWTGPASYSSSSQSPTVTNNAASTHAGDYIITANISGCTTSDTTTVVVLPKPTKPTAAATNSPLCQDQNLMLTGSGSSLGATYNWYGPAAFTSTLQNPIRYQVTSSHAGKYFVYTTLNGCVSDTDSVAVVVNTDPEVNVFPSPGTTICQGKQVTFTTVPINAGTATYEWLVNGSSISTGTPFQTTSLNNGDVVTCVMTSVGTCATPFYDTSAGITMTVQQLLAPSVSTAANPNHKLFPNEPVTFTATPTDAGSNPTYQWQRNGTDIGGATSAVWGANANALSDGDAICAIVYSNYACPNPDTAKSNCITVQIKVSVDDIAANNNVRIYPNPVTSELFIEGISKGTIVELYDVVGRKVYLAVAENAKHIINTSQLAKGNYLLKLSNENSVPVVKKVVKE
ncbi:MAG: T9SS type A sorting domain-containing protein [Chitinophagales bacterium]|nr:T9SS type A sorting domain-containing protein [Chitinophagales bacterium]